MNTELRNVRVLASVLSLALALGVWSAGAARADGNEVKEKTAECSDPESSIQHLVDKAKKPTIIHIPGDCEEDVTITRDDITLDGGGTGVVTGTIAFVGAQRGVVSGLTVTGPGAGVSIVRGASVEVRDSEIVDNERDGIGVFDGAFARIVNNLISGNGRPAQFEAGIQVGRAVARGQGNTITGNPYAAIEVFNGGSYRTGSFITATGQADNAGPPEVISTGGIGAVAVELGQMAYVDLRQVVVTGNISVGRHSMVQVRGDNAGPDRFCSVVDGDVRATGTLALARLRFTHVTGSVVGLVNGGSTPAGSCPNVP